MKARRSLMSEWLLVFLVASALVPGSAVAQADPVAQCAEGVRLYLEGRDAEAMPLLEAGFAGRADAAFTRPADLGECALVLGAMRGNLNNYAGVLEANAVAVEVFRSSGTREGEIIALTGMGRAYYWAGRFAEALDSYSQVLAIAREMDDRELEGEKLNDIGVVYRSQGRYAKALESMEQALVITREMGNRAGEARTLNNIGVVHDDQGNTSKALEVYQQALIIRREVGDRLGESNTLNNIGIAYLAQGRMGKAMNTFEQALAMAEDLDAAAGPATTLDNIGDTYENQGRFAEALEQHQQALTFRRLAGDRAGEGITLSNIGVVLVRQGRNVEALEAVQQSLDIHRGTGDRRSEARSLHNLGAIYEIEGRYAEARDVLQQGLAIEREVGDRTGEANTLNEIGAIFAKEGYYAEASDHYYQALTLARETEDRAGEWIALGNLGDAFQRQEQANDALSYYAEAMDVFELARSQAGSEAARSSFMASHIGLYNRASQLYYEQGQYAQAFQTSERGRARAFLDSLATGYVELSDHQAAELLTRERESYNVRQAAQDALIRARSAQPTDPTLAADLEAQLASAEQDHAAALAAMQARGDHLASLVPGRSSVLSLAQVQSLLDENTTVVTYQVFSDADSLAFIITANDLQVAELPEATLQNLRTAVDDLNTWQSLENSYPLPLRDLYSWLVAPLVDHLRTRRVAIVPHNVLHYIPFAALTDGKHYLGEQFELSVLPSASSLRFIQQNAAEPDATGALVLSNPASDVPDLKPLAYAEQEASDAASLLGATASLHQGATEARLRADVTGAKVVHLSAHGGYNTANPLYSTIYLAPGDGQDGRLETHEVYGLDLKGNEVVVLSACETNVGELSAGDEVVGLTRAFFFAGAPTVISSLWAVDDAATGALMTAFYRHWLQDGMSKAQALQAAQADVRSESQWASPFYWAGFVLNGDPGTSSTPLKGSASPELATPDQVGQAGQSSEDRLPIMLLAAGGFVLVAAGAIWLIRRRRAW